MLGGADNPNGELPSYITGADTLACIREIPPSFPVRWETEPPRKTWAVQTGMIRMGRQTVMGS